MSTLLGGPGPTLTHTRTPTSLPCRRSCFGKLTVMRDPKAQCKEADLALGLLRMVTINMALLSTCLARQHNCLDRLFFVGGFLKGNLIAQRLLAYFCAQIGVRPKFLLHSDFVGALGSLRCHITSAARKRQEAAQNAGLLSRILSGWRETSGSAHTRAPQAAAHTRPGGPWTGRVPVIMMMKMGMKFGISMPGQTGHFFPRRDARALCRNGRLAGVQFGPTRARHGAPRRRPRISNAPFPAFKASPVLPKSISGQSGHFTCAPRLPSPLPPLDALSRYAPSHVCPPAHASTTHPCNCKPSFRIPTD